MENNQYTPHSSHQMSDWTKIHEAFFGIECSPNLTVTPTTKFGSIRHCKNCGSEHIKTLAGETMHDELRQQCTAVVEKKKIFLVKESGGDYDDAWVNNLHAFTDRDKAEAFVKATQTENQIFIEKQTKLSDMFDDWKITNPYPRASLIPVPRWEPGLGAGQITNEMRAERDRITNQNEEIKRELSERVKLWNDKARLFLNEKRLELGLKITDSLSVSSYFEDTRLSIEEMELD